MVLNLKIREEIPFEYIPIAFAGKKIMLYLNQISGMKYKVSLFIFTISLFSATANAQLQRIYTYVGKGSIGFTGDGGTAVSAELHGPLSVALDGIGNLYIADYYNNRVRKVTSDGIITTVAGNGTFGSGGDGTIGTSAEVIPSALAVDSRNNLYICDALTSVIRKVDVISGLISRFAGNGTVGFSGDDGAAVNAQLNRPYSITFDSKDNLYIADAGNHVVRMVTTAGKISTVAGIHAPGYTGDNGPAIAAHLDSAFSVAVDNWGTMYINDFGNNVIRKVDTFGIITTVAGTGYVGYTGDNAPATDATLHAPKGIAVDAKGNLFIADAGNNVIRKVDTGGKIKTVAGNGTAGFAGDLGYSIGANMNNPYALVVDKAGSLYIADANNQRIRKVYNANLAVNNVQAEGTVSIFPNPVSGNTVTIAGLLKTERVAIFDVTGKLVVGMNVISHDGSEILDISGISAGAYSLQVFNADGVKKSVVKLVKE